MLYSRSYLIHVVWVILLLLQHLITVQAQTSTAFPNPAITPDFNQPRTTLVLITFILYFPCIIVAIVLLWKRRKHFPIAGRGSGYLLVLGFLFLGCCLICSVGGLVYPYGLPCGIEYLLQLCFSAPTAVIYMLRGWTLVFRLEIKNYLTELRWRQEKRKMMKAYQEQQAAAEVNEHEPCESPNSDVAAVSSPAVPLKINVKPSHSLIEIVGVDEDPTTIPGYFFIHHRRWIESKFFFPFVGAFAVVVAILVILVGIFDPDINLTNKNFHREGVLPDGVDYASSQFLPDTFLSSPVCLVYGIKNMLFVAIIMVVMSPTLVWCSWRILLDKGRQVARKKDQAECYKLVYSKELETVETTKEKLGLSMDDSQNVKNEFGIIIILAIIYCCSWALVEIFTPGYMVLVLEWSYIVLFVISIAMPLYLSYSLSRKHRELLDRSKRNSHSKKSDKDGIYNRLPHQRPYFTLKYILHHSHTYDVLLAFLQKEYSSENALFWAEARAFEKAAKELEVQIPTWPSSLDSDDLLHGVGSGMGSGSGGGGGTTFSSPRHSSNGGGEGSIRLPHHLRSMSATPNTVQLAPLKQSTPLPPAFPSRLFHHPSTDTELPSCLPSPSNNRRGVILGGLSDSMHISPTVLSPSSVTSLPPPSTVAAGPAAATATTALLSLQPSPSASVPLSPSHGGTITQLAQAVDLSGLHAEATRLKTWAEQIYQDYIKRASVMEINIPEDLSKLTQSQLSLLSSWSPTPLTQVTGDPDYSSYPLPPPFPLSTLYKQTQLAVFDLIQRDSFRRFILTPGFQQLLHQADEDELARLEKQNDLIMDTAEVVDKAMAELRAGSTDQLEVISPHGSVGPSQPRRSVISQQPLVGGSIVNNAGISRLRHDQPLIIDEPPSPPNEDGDNHTPLPGQTPAGTACPSPTGSGRMSAAEWPTSSVAGGGIGREGGPEDDLPHFEQPAQSRRTSLSVLRPPPPQTNRAQVYLGGITPPVTHN